MDTYFLALDDKYNFTETANETAFSFQNMAEQTET
jgi:hypothetical protein